MGDPKTYQPTGAEIAIFTPRRTAKRIAAIAATVAISFPSMALSAVARGDDRKIETEIVAAANAIPTAGQEAVQGTKEVIFWATDLVRADRYPPVAVPRF
jgi:hypothetical protein